MIDLELYLAFVLAATVLIVVPGPNVALIVANSVAHGTRYGFLTVAGTGSAMAAQLATTALGMSALLGTLADWFEWIRWAGVAYLAYLGVKAWRAGPTDLTTAAPQARAPGRVFARGFLVSLTNPKTLLFYGAFFPQFVTADDRAGAQILLLSVTFLVLGVLLDGAWALLAGRARGLLAGRGRLRNRVSGALLIGAGVGLAMARRR